MDKALARAQEQVHDTALQLIVSKRRLIAAHLDEVPLSALFCVVPTPVPGSPDPQGTWKCLRDGHGATIPFRVGR